MKFIQQKTSASGKPAVTVVTTTVVSIPKAFMTKASAATYSTSAAQNSTNGKVSTKS